MEAWRLLAHNHWLTVNLLGFRVRLCARCSGYLLGLTAFTLMKNLLRLAPWSQTSMVVACVLLSSPLVWDWVTQSWGLRDSTNFNRVLTGCLMGLGTGVFSTLSISLEAKRIIFVSVAAAVLALGLNTGTRTKTTS